MIRMTGYAGPAAGGPWHGKNLVSEHPYMGVASVGALPKPGAGGVLPPLHLQTGQYLWHADTRLWVWHGPDIRPRELDP